MLLYDQEEVFPPCLVLAMGLKVIPYEEEMLHLARLETGILIHSKVTALPTNKSSSKFLYPTSWHPLTSFTLLIA